MLQVIAIYLLKTIIVSAVLLLYYWFALRNKRFHYYNRFYLLSVVVLSIILPLVNISFFTFSSSSDKAIGMFNVMNAEGETELFLTGKTDLLNWQQMLLLSGLAVTLVLLLILTYRIITIYRIKKKYPVCSMQEFDFINTDLQQAPFSFLKNIFWRNDISMEERTGRLILQHELAHIKQKHTWDKLFMQIVITVLWANPLCRFIQKELYLIHEFIADNKSVTDKDTAVFAEMLLCAHYGKFNFYPAQPFFYSPIKRRLQMLTTSKEPKFSYARRLMALPLLAFVILLFAFRLQKENDQTLTTIKPGTTFKLVVDAGHGGEDNGALAADGTKEKDIALTIAKKIKALSGEYGIDVIMTRNEDMFMNPKEKAEFSNKQNADAFISVHANAASANGQQTKSGIEVVIAKNNDNGQLDKSKVLGSALLQQLSGKFAAVPSLLQRQVGIWVLQANAVPAVLVECGYLTNTDDLALLKNDATIELMARNILQGVANYANNSSNAVTSYEVKMQEENAFADTTIPDNVLYVLNGEVKNKTDIDKLNPANIKSVDVLKGESAINLYGDRGKNGVVVIFTKDFKPKTPVEIVTSAKNAPLYIVDDIEMNETEFKTKVAADNIASVDILKDNAAKKYGKKGKYGVIIITTKDKDRNGSVIIVKDTALYVIDGKIAASADVRLLEKENRIESVNVLKGKPAMDKYGDKGKNGVVEITTKNNEKFLINTEEGKPLITESNKKIKVEN